MNKQKALKNIKIEIEKIIGIPLSCTFYQQHLLFKKQDNDNINQNIMEFLVSFAMKYRYEIHIKEWNDNFNKIYLKEPVTLNNINANSEIVIDPNIILYDH